MNIASLGDVTFSVSDSVIQTFRNLKYTESASYSQHKPHGRMAVPEFTGFDAPQITFEITLSAYFGVNPRKEYDKLREMLLAKKGYALAIGTELFGDLWLVTNLSRAFDYLYKDGTPTQYKVSITLLGMEG